LIDKFLAKPITWTCKYIQYCIKIQTFPMGRACAGGGAY
jgi:hypothetical protein